MIAATMGASTAGILQPLTEEERNALIKKEEEKQNIRQEWADTYREWKLGEAAWEEELLNREIERFLCSKSTPSTYNGSIA